MINTKLLTHLLIDALTRHGGYTGLSAQECEARVIEALTEGGVCVCGGFTSAGTVTTVEAPVEVAKPARSAIGPARKPRSSK